MPDQVPASLQHLLEDDSKTFAMLATLMPDGSPQVTPVWFNFQDGLIWINTAVGRVKYRNMQARPRVAIAIQDPEDPETYLQLRGRVAEIVEEGAAEHINQLSHKYRGADFNIPAGQVRAIFKIRPEHISGE